MTHDLTPPAVTGKRAPFSRTFQALRYRDFRLYWLALGVSLLGVSFQTVAQGWLIYRLTGSATMLGVAGFIPAVLAAPAGIVGGILADRVSRRKLVIVTQTLLVIPPVALAYLIWRGPVQVWQVIAATAVMAIVVAFDAPSRAAMVPQLVGPDDILNAQSLSSTMRQAAQIIGPALAGMVIGAVGEAVCFLINGLSYLAMSGAFLFMRPQPALPRGRRNGLRATLLDGFVYVWRTPMIMGLFAIVAAQGLFLGPYVTLLPVFATDILKVGAPGLGWLTASVGAGALLGALGLANLGRARRGGVLFVGSLIMPFVMAAFAWSQRLTFSVPLLMAVGIGTVIINTITGTMVLVLVPDDVRGRVTGLGLLIWLGAPFIGSLPAGILAEHWGAPITLSLTALLFLATMIVVGIKVPDIRRWE